MAGFFCLFFTGPQNFVLPDGCFQRLARLILMSLVFKVEFICLSLYSPQQIPVSQKIITIQYLLSFC